MSNRNEHLSSADNYNLLIWTIFSVGIALSLYLLLKVWPDKTNLGAMQFFMSVLGFIVLFYCILAIESFGQKKNMLYKISNSNTETDIGQRISNLPYIRLNWLAEIILFFIFIAYLYQFCFIWLNKSLGQYGPHILQLAPIMFFISLIMLGIILYNWFLRPQDKNGNLLEKIRLIFFRNFTRNY